MISLQYEDGTVFTIKAKDVKKQIVQVKKRPARSRSRGRSPGRKASSRGRKQVDLSPDTSPEVKVKAPKSAAKPKATPKAKVEPPTPTRQSTRIATRRALAELSGDESEQKPKPSKASSIKTCISGKTLFTMESYYNYFVS